MTGADRSEADRSEAAAKIREVFEELLDGPVDPRVPFLELGLTSLTLVRIRLRLERQLSRPLADQDLWQFANLDALTANLLGTEVEVDDGVAAEAGAEVAAKVDDRGDDDRAAVAIIGMAAVLPGADDLDEFWRNLRDGRCTVSSFDDPDAGPQHRAVAGVLRDVECFDAEFFGMSRAEAELTDPAHRLFLQCCHQALEQAGYTGSRPAGRVGVYAGSGMNLYGPQLPYHAGQAGGGRPGEVDIARRMQALIGGQQDFLATRVAYRLGLTGAAMSVQTACSTGLVAVHLAVQSLLAGEQELALAGAAAVHLPQEAGYSYDPEFIMSPSGICRAFDAASDGTVGGNGVAAVLLKRLDRAMADGDHIHAVIIGSAVNNDGRDKAGFTAPGVRGHADVVRQALSRAGIEADSVGYVEAHGTGTALGDAVEFEALSQGYRSAAGRTGHCALGSVKPSVGHLDTCAGMAGLLKVVLMLSHSTIVATANVSHPNPALRWDESPFHLADTLRRWPDGGPARAGMSALGFGGTNAHVVLQAAPEPVASAAAARALVLPLSAPDEPGLRALAASLGTQLAKQPNLPAGDVQYTLALGRAHHRFRAAVTGRTAAELAAALGELARSPVPPADSHGRGTVAFAFSGQGKLRCGAAQALYDRFEVVRAVIDEADGTCQREGAGSVAEVLLGGAGELVPSGVAQSALFVLQLAMARLWRELGVVASCTVGHSLGELAALCEAGALPPDGALRFVIARQQAISETEPGQLLAVRATRAVVDQIAGEAGLDLAAVNGPRAFVLSGASAEIKLARRLAEQAGVTSVALPVGRGYHSALLDPVLPQLRAAAGALVISPLRLAYAASATGQWLPPGTVLDAGYLVDQVRRPVLFSAALQAIYASGCRDLIELGAATVLAGLGRAIDPDTGWIPSLADPVTGSDPALAAAFERGLDLRWDRVVAGGRLVPLVPTPLRRTRIATRDAREDAREAAPDAAPRAAPGNPGTELAQAQLAAMSKMLGNVSELMSAQLRSWPAPAARPR